MPEMLAGLRIVEFEGIGPVPYAGMLLADMGAEVVRIARPVAERGPLIDDTGDRIMARGRAVLRLDLKDVGDLAIARRLLTRADGLLEGFRPGVMERLDLGPEAVRALNPRLVYARVTGWGQQGPLSQRAGHDINYIALSGVLAAIGPEDRPPPPPLNLVGDFGGGGLLAALSMLGGLIAAARDGEGAVLDCAMLDGAISQMSLIQAWAASGRWQPGRGRNLLDGAAPFYRCYACADGRFVAVGAIEPGFFAALLAGLGLDPECFDQTDRAGWPEQAGRIAAVFATRPRDDWAAAFAGTDACVSPVLDLWEAPDHAHNRARKSFVGTPAQGPCLPRRPGVAEVARPGVEIAAEALLARWEG